VAQGGSAGGARAAAAGLERVAGGRAGWPAQAEEERRGCNRQRAWRPVAREKRRLGWTLDAGRA
jgi:hypothetical protein